MSVERTGLDKDGKVVEDLKKAVKVREVEYDEEGNVVKETVYKKA